MDPLIVGVIGFATFIILVLLGMRIAFAAALIAFVGLVVIKGWGTAGDTVGFLAYSIPANFVLTIIPLFIIMGHFALFAGFTHDIFTVGRQWVGHLPGGLAMASVLGCAGFAACSGASTAAAAVMGKAAIPEMRRYGYDRKLAAGVIAASGTLASLIPPSNMLVIYGIITEQSIGALLIAGFIPGIVSAIIYMLMIYFRIRLNPQLGPPLPAIPWKERFIGLRGIWGMLTLLILVLGGIYSGIFTPTEAGGGGAAGAFLLALLLRKLSWSNLKESLLETGKTTVMIFAILVGVLILMRFLALSGLTTAFTTFALGLPLPPLAVLVGILFVYVILGMFMTAVGTMMLTLPLVLPVIVGLGYDPIWFGIIVVKMCEIAFITPPVAVNVYVVKSVAPDIPIEVIYRGIGPFLLMDFVTLSVLIAFPQIVLFLPNAMMRG